MSIKQHNILELVSTGAIESMLSAALNELVQSHHQQIRDHVDNYTHKNKHYDKEMYDELLHIIDRVRPNGTVGQVHKDIIAFFGPVFKRISLYDLLNKEANSDSDR